VIHLEMSHTVRPDAPQVGCDQNIGDDFGVIEWDTHRIQGIHHKVNELVDWDVNT